MESSRKAFCTCFLFQNLSFSKGWISCYNEYKEEREKKIVQKNFCGH